jgi:hypothetical protein
LVIIERRDGRSTLRRRYPDLHQARLALAHEVGSAHGAEDLVARVEQVRALPFDLTVGRTSWTVDWTANAEALGGPVPSDPEAVLSELTP